MQAVLDLQSSVENHGTAFMPRSRSIQAVQIDSVDGRCLQKDGANFALRETASHALWSEENNPGKTHDVKM